MINKLKALSCYVILKVDEDEEVKVGALIIPDTATKRKLEQFERGLVVDLGAAAFDYLEEDQRLVKKGDYVLFKKHAGVALTENGGISSEKVADYRIVNDKDILTVEVNDE